MSGKFFNTGVIKPKGFIDYVPENLKPGNYSFYSSTDPQIKGQLVVIPNYNQDPQYLLYTLRRPSIFQEDIHSLFFRNQKMVFIRRLSWVSL